MVSAPTEQRRLAAIMFTDMVGYSALSQQNEPLALELLDEHRAVLRAAFARHGGREIEAVGDGFFVEFPSALDGARCAVDIQQSLADRNAAAPPERRVQVRIGLHLGDVVQRGQHVHGDGVNIAARIEPLAAPGGICLSEDVARQIQNKIELPLRKLGKGELKNIRLPVDIYRIGLAGERHHLPFWDRVTFYLRRKWTGLTAAVLMAVVVIAGVSVYLWPRAHDRTNAADPVLALPTGPSVAVLPFDNLSKDPEQEYFVDGITEDIISALARFDLRVIARNSSFQYKGRAVDIREIGRKLGARYVLEGSVRRATKRIRVSAQLLDASTGAHLWAQNFDRELTASSIFVVQDEIATRVVAAIAQPHGGVISLVGAKASAGKDTESLSAYDCVLQAYEYWRIEGTAKKHLEVRECLERAVQENPNYSQAWAMLADNCIQEFQTNRNKRPDWLDRASRAAHRAVELDPNNYAARYALAHVYFFQHDLQRFFAEADRALELNPHDPTYLAWLGVLTAYAGKWQRGLALADKSVELNPDYPSWLNYLWFHDHYRKGEYQQALEKMLSIRTEPGNFWNHAHLAQAYAQLGRKEEAAAEIKKLVAIYPDFAENARAQWKAWNWTDENTEAMLDGLRKAGLDIPDE
jgi:adenylate cyclase